MDLPLHNGRVDPHATVVDGDEPAHLHLPGARVHLDDAHVGAVREGEVRRVVHTGPVEVAVDTVRQVHAAVRGQGDLPQCRTRLRRATHGPPAGCPLEVGLVDLQ